MSSRRMSLLSALLLAVSAGLLNGCDRPAASGPKSPASTGTSAAPDTGAAAKLKFAVIPKGTTHVFWKSVEAGAKRAAAELGVEVLWKGPLTEDDRAQQIQVVQQFTSQGVDGIALAPLDFKALLPPVSAAMEQQIPVVIFDSALDGEAGKDFVSYIATNNEQGGRLGGEHLAKLLNGKGKLVLLRYAVGSASTDAREKGFLAAIAANPELSLLVDNRYAGVTAGEAKTQALNMLDAIRQADGIFCPNESSTLGMLLALQQEGLAGKVRFVGFDASPPLVQALRDGQIDALVVQNPDKMGYESVQALVKHVRGEPVEPLLDTGVVVVTRENMSEPAIQPLLP